MASREKHYNNWKQNVLNNEEYLKENRDAISKFLRDLSLNGRAWRTQQSYFNCLKNLMHKVKEPFKEMSEEDLKEYFE